MHPPPSATPQEESERERERAGREWAEGVEKLL